MMQGRNAFTQPSYRALRWLADPGSAVPPEIASQMLGELFSSPKAVVAGLLNGLILNIVALAMECGPAFAIFIAVDVVLVTVRLAVVRRAVDAASHGRATPTDLFLVTAAGWCALQGIMAFSAMRTGLLPLQILSATTVMGLVGPICARNYAAPRYAMMLVVLCDMPFVLGAALSPHRWLLILVLQTPLFLFGVRTIIARFHGLAVASLLAEHASHHRARHDALTGLLTRFGVFEILDRNDTPKLDRFILFYLDLDGFKPINDAHGHQCGDAILRMVADRLRLAARPEDLVSRLGGDEFVIVAADMSPAEGAAYAEAIISKVVSEPYVVGETVPLRVGISVGFACTPEDGLPGPDLHAKADLALYQAKAAGKGVQRRFRAAQDALQDRRQTA